MIQFQLGLALHQHHEKQISGSPLDAVQREQQAGEFGLLRHSTVADNLSVAAGQTNHGVQKALGIMGDQLFIHLHQV